MAAPTMQEILILLYAIELAEEAIGFANTVVMEPSQIEGTRYKYVITNAPDPRE